MHGLKVQIREEMSVMRITGGVLALLFLLGSQSISLAQIGTPMPPPGAVGDPVPANTVPSKNIDRPPRHDKVRCRSHKGACLPKPSPR
jgi:hypothetical protein